MVKVHFHRLSWRNPVSLLISLFTGEIFHHTSIEIDGVVFEALIKKGVVACEKKMNPRKVMSVTLPATTGQRAAIHWWLLQQVGKPYDWKYILTWMWCKKSSNRKYICYELVYKALQHGYPDAELSADINKLDTWVIESIVAKLRGK